MIFWRRIAPFPVFRIVKEVDMVNPATNPTARENPDQSVLTTPFILLEKETGELKILRFSFNFENTDKL